MRELFIQRFKSQFWVKKWSIQFKELTRLWNWFVEFKCLLSKGFFIFFYVQIRWVDIFGFLLIKIFTLNLDTVFTSFCLPLIIYSNYYLSDKILYYSVLMKQIIEMLKWYSPTYENVRKWRSLKENKIILLRLCIVFYVLT